MKRTKFGKAQLTVMKLLYSGGGKARTFAEIHLLLYPKREYPAGYVVPVLMRMEHHGLIKVDWVRGLVTGNPDYKWVLTQGEVEQ